MANPTPQRVCIVGAGPAGLVTAKTFLQYPDVSVTVFEVADRIGGMWRGRKGEYGYKCDPGMRTTLSRFTVAFSDLDWNSVYPQHPEDDHIPVFPSAYEVGKYLEKYSAKFGLDSVIQLNKKVVKAALDDDSEAWKITTKDTVTSQLCEEDFDYLVIASGFFDKPGGSFDPSPSKSLPNMQHSSCFRELSSLTEQAGNIAVIGGGISGSEAAASAALQISSAGTQTGGPITIHSDSTVYHVVNRPFYVLPRYLPVRRTLPSLQDSEIAPKFLPLDLVSFDLGRHGVGENPAATTMVSPKHAHKDHEFLRSLLGGDQSDLGSSALVYTEAQMQYPACTSITDTYAEFVRSGIIIPVQGWVEEIKQRQYEAVFDISLKKYDPWDHAKATEPTENTTISNVVGIIEATGYGVDLEYLDAAVKKSLDCDPSCSRMPFHFTQGSTFGLPTLAAVGFYKGPYWGVMEMQARYIAEIWTKGKNLLDDHGDPSEPHPFNDGAVSLMREAINDELALQGTQSSISDYLGLVESFAKEVGITRDDRRLGHQQGPAFPARYRNSVDDPDGNAVTEEVSELWFDNDGDVSFVAPAVFCGLQGVWNFNRKIDSRIASCPGCSYSGIANFGPRVTESNVEYLYQEDSTFESDNGFSFGVTRNYIYTCLSQDENIYQRFVFQDGEKFGRSFFMLEFGVPDLEDGTNGWIAYDIIADCEPSTDYSATYEFKFRGAKIETFYIRYKVLGPDQDYTHETWYTRPEAKSLKTSCERAL